MADLQFTVDYKQLKEANREISKVGSNAQKSASVFEAAFKRAEAQSVKSARAVREQITFSQRLERQKAREANAVAAAAAAERKSVEQNTVALNRLRSTYNANFAVEQRTLELKKRLRQEIANGNMTVRQAGAELLKYRAHMQQFNIAQMAATKSSNRMGVVTQQAGYQIGDFLVQVQSGTNFMVAFGQQATQLVGILPLLAPSGGTFLGLSAKGLIGLSAGLGIAIPLVTALGAAFLRTRPEAEKATTSFEGVKDALDKIEAVNFGGLGKEFLDVAKEIRQEFSAILDVVEEVARTKLEEGLSAPLKAVIKELESFEARASIAAQLGAGTPTFGGQFGLESMNEAIFLATQLKTLNGETKEELQGQLNAITDALFFRGLLTDEVKEMLVGLAGEVSLIEDLEAAVSKTADEAKNLKDNLILSDSEFQQMLYYQQYAETMAVGLGKAADEAGRLKTNLSDPQFQQMLYYQQYAETMGAAPDSPVNPPRTSGGSRATSIKDPLPELLKRLALDERLLGVSKEREAVERAIADSDVTYSQASIDAAVKRLEAYNLEKEALEEVAATQEKIASTIENSMENAFMSMVDGTKSAKDAFKSMAADIIKELYRVLVVQQLVGSFKTGGGGILGSLAPIFGRASGGTVMSNTPYLVGEKGPEVIVPQNRGHVMNADLTAKAMGNGGGAVTVVQNFNFSANGDDSVKRIIAQAAPQIAQMTKKSIIDDRRRGGQMKATFG